MMMMEALTNASTDRSGTVNLYTCEASACDVLYIGLGTVRAVPFERPVSSIYPPVRKIRL